MIKMENHQKIFIKNQVPKHVRFAVEVSPPKSIDLKDSKHTESISKALKAVESKKNINSPKFLIG